MLQSLRPRYTFHAFPPSHKNALVYACIWGVGKIRPWLASGRKIHWTTLVSCCLSVQLLCSSIFPLHLVCFRWLIDYWGKHIRSKVEHLVCSLLHQGLILFEIVCMFVLRKHPYKCNSGWANFQESKLKVNMVFTDNTENYFEIIFCFWSF